jgi:ubiquinone/menaquinone biosynthesis C-methylase UbiE
MDKITMSTKAKKVKRHWRSPYHHRFTDLTDALASSYNLGFPIYNWGFTVLGGRKHEAFRQRVIELAGLQGDELVLDAACGTGLTTLRITEQHADCIVHGIDLSLKMIEAAQKDAVERGLSVNLCVGSITDLPYPDASFDVIFTNIMFHHLDLVEKRQAVSEIARVLKLGGRYVSAEFGPRANSPLERRLAKGEYTLYPSHLSEAGFVIKHKALDLFVWGLRVYYRVAVKTEKTASES